MSRDEPKEGETVIIDEHDKPQVRTGCLNAPALGCLMWLAGLLVVVAWAVS